MADQPDTQIPPLTPRHALERIRTQIDAATDGDYQAIDIGPIIDVLDAVDDEGAVPDPADLRDRALRRLELAVEGDLLDGAELAHAIEALHQVATTSGPELDAKLLARAATYLQRSATALASVVEVQGRFVRGDHPDPEMAAPAFQRARLLPEGFEDLTPTAIEDVARRLRAAAGDKGSRS